MTNKAISIIIPNWNGRELLEKNLPPLLKAAEFSKVAVEIIVVDDASTDESVSFLENNYPQIKIIALKQNRGFSHACNQGAKASQADILYFLNNDVVVNEDFISPLLRHFGDNRIFAVGSWEVPKDNNEIDSLVRARFIFGCYYYRYEKIYSRPKEAIPVPFVSGGHVAFRKDKFLSLGGFDELYQPIYFEDHDICYRAWKAGGKILIEPNSQVKHYYQSSVRKRKDLKIQEILWKNRFLFTWKNISSFWLLFQHFFFLPFELLFFPLKGNPNFTIGFFQALKELKEVKKRRKVVREFAKLSDYKIFKLFRDFEKGLWKER